MKTLIIDNYDSFTYNLFQLLAKVTGEEPIVIANDSLDLAGLRKLGPDNIVISPGPGRPNNERDFGVCRQAILEYDAPLFGVCLGLQGIGDCFGGRVVHAPEPFHGRTSRIIHDNGPLFAGIPQGFEAVRYHSLVLDSPLPAELERIAWTSDGLIMGIRHRSRPIWAVQFHPESICTEYGFQLIRNFFLVSQKYYACGARKGGLNLSSCSGETPSKTTLCFAAKQENDASPKCVFYRKLDLFPELPKVFARLWDADTPAFWLDSSLVEEGISRFSFMGGGLATLLVRYFSRERRLMLTQHGHQREITGELFDFLNEQLQQFRTAVSDLPFDFAGGFVGYLGYELKQECGAGLRHISQDPDAAMFLADRFIAFDHLTRSTYLVVVDDSGKGGYADRWFDEMEYSLARLDRLSLPVFPNTEEKAVRFVPEHSHREYIADIESAQRYIRDGESYEVCLTSRLRATTTQDPLAFYLTLRRINPAPYSAFLRFPGLSVACSSPERFLRIDRKGFVESKPIKGTSGRSSNLQEDEKLADQLVNNAKDRSENLMIVDLLRNDLGKVSVIGSVNVPHLMKLESYATVHQLVSTIRARLRPETSVVDCIRAAFPGGSMTGAPKLRTMEIIDQLESSARGVYSGAIGFLGANDTADLNVVIRTAVFRQGQVSIGVGGAVVALSRPEDEFAEILLKARALLHTFEQLTGKPCVVDTDYNPIGSGGVRMVSA